MATGYEYIMTRRKQTRATSENTRTRAIAYIRVSTDRQAEHGVSLAAQEAKLTAYASLYDLDLVAIVVDAGLSAKNLDRPGLQGALAKLAKGEADALLVVSLSRLTRSVRDLGTLVDCYFGPKGAALMSLSESIDTRTAAGRLVLNVLGAVSAWERDAVCERTSAAMQHKQARGEYIGGHAPYGFALADDGALVEVASEQSTIADARALAARGMSLRAIAADLASRGLVARSGKPFAAVQVSRMVASAPLPPAANE
jgi:DNA invertase Pin-like site-specific DNA recombinase